MRIFASLAAAAILVPGTATASSMVIGSGFARMCYDAAEAERANAATQALCTRAMAEEPLSYDDQVATYVNRGIIRARMDDRAGALADYDRAIALNPAEPEAYLNKGALVLKQGDWRQARDLFDAALARQTSRPEYAYFGRAVAQETGGDVVRAYADYLKAAAIAPEWEHPKKELARFSVRKSG